MDAACAELARVLATPESLEALERAGEDGSEYLARHQHRDWGQINESDQQRNEQAMIEGGRVLSQYQLRDGQWIWIVSDLGTSTTTFLVPGQF